MATRQPFRKWGNWKWIGSYSYIPCRLQSRTNQKKQYGHQAAILKMMLLKINRLLTIYISIVLLKFGVDYRSQTKFRVRKPKNPIWPPARFLKVTSLKINRLLPMTTINMYMKFQIEIPKQTWLMLRKPCRLQTDGRTDGRTDGQGESSIPPSNFVGRGYNDNSDNDGNNDNNKIPVDSPHKRANDTEVWCHLCWV